MKVAFFDLEGWESDFINLAAKRNNFDVILENKLPPSIDILEPVKDANIISVFLSTVTKEMIDFMPNLNMICLRTTGFDYVDRDECSKRGIIISNVPKYGEITVAEYAFSLMLALSRKICKTYFNSRLGNFDRLNIRGVDISGKTIGVVGTGKIGYHFIKMLSGFDVTVLAYDKFENENLSKMPNVKYVSFDELIQFSDIISLHLPYMPETHHIINVDVVKKMKHGVLLVNVSRGGLIDCNSVLYGLEKNIFGGVALDTFEGENMWCECSHIINGSKNVAKDELISGLINFKLQQFDNVILTPHNAYNSKEALMRILNVSLENISEFIKTGTCSNRVQ